jgi:hypothetical protein
MDLIKVINFQELIFENSFDIQFQNFVNINLIVILRNGLACNYI